MRGAVAARMPWVWMLALMLAPAWSRGDTHSLRLSDSEAASWRVEVNVDGVDVKFIEEGNTGDEQVTNQVILYTAPKIAEIVVSARYFGALPDGVEPVGFQMEIHEQTGVNWEAAGGTASTVVNLTTNRQEGGRVVLVQGRVLLYTTDSSITPSAHFSTTLYIIRPMSVTAGSGSGGVLPIYAHAQRPCLVTNTAGLRWVDYCFEPLPDASVKAEAIEVVNSTSAWLTTDSIGRAMAQVWAPVSAEPDAAGLVHGRVLLKGTKDRANAEHEADIRIPYAGVADANGATLVARRGAILEPIRIIPGDNLLPGDVVQVGNEVIWSGAYLTIRFCNGQQVTLQSDSVTGVRAIVGQGSLDHRTPVLHATLQSFVQDLRSDPRRYGRLAISKALGNVVDGLLGIPGPVSWTVQTPGGAIEEWLVDFSEAALPRRGEKAAPAESGTAKSETAADAAWASGTVDFYTDGTARLYNRGGTLRVAGPSASASLPRGAMTAARFGGGDGALAPLGVSAATGFGPLLDLLPAAGTTDAPARPDFEVRVTEFGGNNVLPGGVVTRVDGTLLVTAPRIDNRYLFTLPPGMSLAPGAHQWDVELALSGGGMVRTSLTFQVTTNLPAPRDVRATVGAQRVALRWESTACDWARGGFRVYRTTSGGGRQLISGAAPLREPNFVDAAPLAGALYEVTGLDGSGREGPPSVGVSPVFPGPAPATPRAVAVTPQVFENGAGIGLAIEDPSGVATLWRIESGPAAEGPFTDVLGGELTCRSPWPVRDPFGETRRWFRVTPLNADGVAGPSTVAGPVDLPLPLPAVLGLTASPNPDGSVLLRWNPWSARPLAGYRIERWTNNVWLAAGEVGPETTAWTDTAPAPGGLLRQWRVCARLAGGGESPLSLSAAVRAMTVPADRGVVRFESGAVEGVEGETVMLRVIRQGGLELPAIVTWSSWSWDGPATPEEDFTPGGGTLIFAPGETEKVIAVPLLTDNALETTDESFAVRLLGAEGGPVLGMPATAFVTIGAGPELSWDPQWQYAVEGAVTQVTFRVSLSRSSSREVRVDFQFEPERSTATTNADFTGPLAGTLVFPPGALQQSFSIAVVNDTAKEGTGVETVEYRLLNPQGAWLDELDPFRPYGTLQIGDDDTRPGYVVFADRTVRLREGESRVLTLRREGGTDGPIDVFIFPMGGTAAENTDWTLTPRNPRFEDGQTEGTVTLAAPTDGQSEGAELVVLNLQGGMGPGQGSSLLVTMADADGSTSGFTAWADQTLASYPTAARQPTADADGDGYPNWIEFLWRTNPGQPDRPAPPQQSFSPWGEWELVVTVREDAGIVVWAEFAEDPLWSQPGFDAGQWQSNGDGTRTGTFRYFNFGGLSGFARFRAEWLAAP